jgi:hypothetical protein
MVGPHVNLHYTIKTSDWTCLSMPTIRCFAGCSALSKVQELDFQCMCANFWPISLSCHMTFNTHTHTLYIYIYTYSQILTSNGIPHIHVFSQVDMLLTRWKENPLQPTEHCVASTVGPHSIPMDSDFLWLQASQRIGTNACQFPVSNAGHRFSEIRTKNGKLILLQNELVRCQLSIGCIIPILCNLWYRWNLSKFFCKARFRFYI